MKAARACCRVVVHPQRFVRSIKERGICSGLGFCGELFQAWEVGLSPYSEKPVGSEFGGQDPHPWVGSPVGNQAGIVL